MPPLQSRRPRTPIRRRLAPTGRASWRQAAGLVLCAVLLGCAGSQGPSPQAAPPGRAGDARDTAAGAHGYWLDDANGAGYMDLMLTSRPIAALAGAGPAELAAVGAVLLTTYRQDSIWNQDGHPFRPVVRAEALDPAARAVRINGKAYRYSDASLPRVLDLLRHPQGTIPIARIRRPLEGGDEQAARLIQWLEGADE